MNQLLQRMNIAVRFSEAQPEAYNTMFLIEQLKLLDRILKEEKYYASTFYIPGEIAALFDIPVLYMERIAGFAAANRLIKGLSTRRIKLGMPICGCTYQLIFECLIDEGIIPPPSGFIMASFACDDAYMYCMAASSKYSVPVYFVDVMRVEDEESIQYLGIQFKNLYKKLKSNVRQVRQIDEVVNLSNATINLKNKIDRLRIEYPGIMESSDSFKLFTLYNDLGRSYALNIIDEMHSTLEKRVVGYQPIKCLKLLWIGVIPLFNNGILKKTEKRYSCRIVYEDLFNFGNCIISANDFFVDLSRRIISSQFFSVNKRVSEIIRYIKDIKVDGVICFSQRNCRFLPPMLPILRMRLEDLGVPIVEICGDAIDPDYFEESHYWDNIDIFFEMVDRRGRMCI